MTGQGFSEVDFDLLADYVGGALDGTPEEAIVARRIAEEPAWAEAHAALSEATGSVHASLASWGESAEPMPAEVTDRIATALAQEPHRPALSLVPDDQDGPPRTAPRARRRLPRWAAPAAIAAGVAALAGFGLAQVDGLGSDSDYTADTVAGAPAATNGHVEAGPGTGPYVAQEIRLAASGKDYRAAGLDKEAGPTEDGNRPLRSGGETAAKQQEQSPTALGRLSDQAALAACVNAISGVHPRGVTDVEVVDLASFEGSPAAIVFFTDGSGARWVWASGPECGLAGRGADTRYSARIG